MRRLLKLLALPLAASSCSASGDGSEASQRKPPSAVAPTNNPPSQSYGTSPPGGRAGQTSSGGLAGSGGTATQPMSSGGSGGSFAGTTGAGLAGSSASAGGSGGTRPATGESGTGSSPPSTSGNSGGTNSPPASAGAPAGGTSAQPACPSETRVRLANGTCVDRITEFPVGKEPKALVIDSNGKLWFEDAGTDEIVQVDTQGKSHDRIPLPKGPGKRELLTSGGTGDAAAVWFTDSVRKTLSRFSKADGVLEIDIGFVVADLVLGSNNHLFVAEEGRGIHELTQGGEAVARWEGSADTSLAFGPDGNLWFPQHGTLTIARLTRSGVRDDFKITDGFPSDICAGPDSALWFADPQLDQIGRMDTTGGFRTFDLPLGADPRRIVAGRDRALWFTQTKSDKIGRMDIGATRPEHFSLGNGSRPYGIAIAADGAVWFTESGTGKIGRLIPDPVPAP